MHVTIMYHWRNVDIKLFQYESKCKFIPKGVETLKARNVFEF